MADNEQTAEQIAADAAAAAAAAAQQPDVAALQAATAAAVGKTRELLQAANPDLPEAAFAGNDVAAIEANIGAARAIVQHATEHAAQTKPAVPTAPATVPGAGLTRQPTPIPDTASGVSRIAYALARGDKPGE